MWRWLTLCLIPLLTACTSAAASEARLPAERTIEVTRIVEVTRVVEVVVTATPLPTPEPVVLMPTPTPPPLPDGWNTYTLINNHLSVGYPASWRVENESSDSVIFANPPAFVQVVGFEDGALGLDEAGLRVAKMTYADSNRLDTIRFRNEGSLELPRQNVYFIAVRTDYVYEVNSSEMQVLIGNGQRKALVYLSDVGASTLSDAHMETAKQILMSIRFID